MHALSLITKARRRRTVGPTQLPLWCIDQHPRWCFEGDDADADDADFGENMSQEAQDMAAAHASPGGEEGEAGRQAAAAHNQDEVDHYDAQVAEDRDAADADWGEAGRNPWGGRAVATTAMGVLSNPIGGLVGAGVRGATGHGMGDWAGRAAEMVGRSIHDAGLNTVEEDAAAAAAGRASNPTAGSQASQASQASIGADGPYSENTNGLPLASALAGQPVVDSGRTALQEELLDGTTRYRGGRNHQYGNLYDVDIAGLRMR